MKCAICGKDAVCSVRIGHEPIMWEVFYKRLPRIIHEFRCKEHEFEESKL